VFETFAAKFLNQPQFGRSIGQRQAESLNIPVPGQEQTFDFGDLALAPFDCSFPFG
jgi:hypothetical protein